MKNTNKNLPSISGWCLMLLTFLFAFSQAHAQQGASLIVNTLAEGDDGVCNAAHCTLREAVKYAPAGATITFSVTGIIQLTQRELAINKNLTITGPGASSLTVNGIRATGGSAATLFDISGGIVSISGLTLSNGVGKGVNAINPNTGTLQLMYFGGAIYMSGGTVTVTGTTLSNNSIASGGGGAIYGGGGSLTIVSSTLSGNRSGMYGGGGIYMNAGSLLMTDSTVSGNASTGVGGGVYLYSNTTATVTNSTISGNSSTAQFGGGGGFFNNGTLTITNSTISGNSTTATRQNSAADGGGGINNQSQLTVANSTITANTAYNGGGIHSAYGEALKLSNSIVAGNTGNFAPDILGTVTAGDYNLVQNTQNTSGSTLSGTHNVTGQHALLGSLENNGGPTQTHALFPGSPAIDAGDPIFDTTAAPYDQRGSGFPRQIGSAIDIGAYELKPDPSQSGSSFVVNSLFDSDNGVCGVTRCTLREAVKYAPAGATITFSVTGTITLTLREMVIAKSLTITGPASAPGITVSGNNASRIFSVNSGTVTISSLTLTRGNGGGSLESGTGGAIYNRSFNLTLRDSTLSGNRAVGKGGAIHNFGTGFVAVINSTLSGNTVVRISSTSTNTGVGGAIYNGGSFRVNNSTVFSNTADLSGGGIHTDAPSPGLPNTSLRVSGTIVAGNTAPNSPDLFGTVASGDYNLVQDTSGATLSGTHNITGQSPLLGSLANNGGSTFTHEILAGSPAIDAGDPNFDVATLPYDQRGVGYTRKYGSAIDIGAFEAQPVLPPADLTVMKTHIGNFTQGDTGKNYSITVTNSGGTPTSGSVSVTDTLPAGLTATAISGNGWTCNLGTLTCTRSDALAAADNYPAIILTVDVANNASASVTNTATVSGGGETNTGNNQAADATTINAAPRYSISGTVKYGTTNAGQPDSFVSGVNLNATGTASASAVSDSGGNYFISNLLGGNYTVTPTKTGEVRGINSLDATRIQQQLVGITTLTANQLIAADTDGNGTVNSLDATRIQQSLIGMNTPNIIGQWKFVPASRQYNALDADQTGQDYQAVLVGEVSGNWASAASPTNNFQTEENEILPETNEQKPTAERFADDFSGRIAENTKQSSDSAANQSTIELLSPAADIQVSLPTNAMSSTGSTVTIPITISQIPAGSSIESFDFSVFYDPAVLQPALTVGNNAGTLSANCSVLPFSPVAGRVIVSGACAQAITTGSGVLYNLTFNVIGASGQTTSLSFVNPANNTNTFQFNNGTPTVSASNGQFNVLAPTAASVSVAGRVLTGAGRGLMNATIVLTDSNGNTRNVHTGAFGYYRFTDVQAGETYIFSAMAKRYTFSQPSRVLNLNEDANKVDFIASSENGLKDFQSEN